MAGRPPLGRQALETKSGYAPIAKNAARIAGQLLVSSPDMGVDPRAGVNESSFREQPKELFRPNHTPILFRRGMTFARENLVGELRTFRAKFFFELNQARVVGL